MNDKMPVRFHLRQPAVGEAGGVFQTVGKVKELSCKRVKSLNLGNLELGKKGQAQSQRQDNAGGGCE